MHDIFSILPLSNLNDRSRVAMYNFSCSFITKSVAPFVYLSHGHLPKINYFNGATDCSLEHV